MSMAKQSTSSKPQPTAIEQAQGVIASLEQQHEALAKRRVAHDAEREQIAYAARVQHDQAASKRLGEMTTEALGFDHEARDIAAALKTAHERLAAEEHKEAVKADRACALALRQEVVKITAMMKSADEFFAAGIDALGAVNAGVEKIHQLGEPFPTAVQMKANIEYSVHTMIQNLPRAWWRDWLRPLAPLQRRSFVGIWAGMARSLENRIRQRLGEPPLAGPEPSAPPLAHNMEHDDGGVEAALAAHRARMAERRERDIARSTELAGAIGSGR